MSADQVIANFLRIATEDLAGARTLTTTGNRNAVYLCEQAAEKIIRAVLTSEGVHAGHHHSLDTMVDDVPDANPLKPLLRNIESLAAYATTYRYPTPSRIKPAPSATELAVYVTNVQTALDAAVRAFQVDLTISGSLAKASGPVR
ncbi:MAG: HEPN domain-containing protein [Polyangiaceae bacterium]